MKLSTDGERVGFETDPEDADLIRAGADGLRAAVTIAEAAGVVGGSDGNRGDCGHCDKSDVPLRDLVLTNDDGEPYPLPVCAACQASINERILSDAEETVDVGVGDGPDEERIQQIAREEARRAQDEVARDVRSVGEGDNAQAR